MEVSVPLSTTTYNAEHIMQLGNFWIQMACFLCSFLEMGPIIMSCDFVTRFNVPEFRFPLHY